MISIYISKDDDVHEWILEWIENKNKNFRNFKVKTGARSPHEEKELKKSTIKTRPNIYYIPIIDVHAFIYRNRFIWLYKTPSSITINLLGFDYKILENLIEEVMDFCFKKQENKTFIYEYKPMLGNIWTKASTQESRSLESIIIPQETKDFFVNDIDLFLKSEKWYNECGIPYKRGYLLYGPSGTGKTAFITALAGHFNKHICICKLSSVYISDEVLFDLMNSAPKDAIVLLEDVDCAFVQRHTVFTNLTFSGLLNAIDGIASGEKRIIFMTTNHNQYLDKALLRPGRVDIKAEFGMANKFQIEKMFLNFFPNEKELSKKVINIIPEHFVTTAELQGFFILNRNYPHLILERAKEWLSEIEKGREKKRNKNVNLKEDSNGKILFKWDKDTCGPDIVISQDGFIVEKMETDKRSWQHVIGTNSFKPNTGIYKWHIKIIRMSNMNNVFKLGIGIIPKVNINYIQRSTVLVGYERGSGWALYCGNGYKGENGILQPFLTLNNISSIKNGDIVSVLLDTNEGTIGFGVNGEFIGSFGEINEEVIPIMSFNGSQKNELSFVYPK